MNYTKQAISDLQKNIYNLTDNIVCSGKATTKLEKMKLKRKKICLKAMKKSIKDLEISIKKCDTITELFRKEV